MMHNSTIEKLHGDSHNWGRWRGCGLNAQFEVVVGDIKIWNLSVISSFPLQSLVNMSINKLGYGF